MGQGRVLLVTAFSVALGCVSGNSAEPPPIDYFLVVSDTIGVAEGDENYMLAWPVDARYTPERDIAVVDMMKNTILFYTPDGEFIRDVGEEGEGPGRFSTPLGIRFASDGAFMVRCTNGISCFSSDYEFEDRMQWPLFGPRLISTLANGNFIGLQQVMDSHARGYICTYTIGRWDGEGDPSLTYHSDQYIIPMPDENGVMDQSERRDQKFFSCVSSDGRVFFAPGSPEGFEVIGVEPDGTLFLHIEDHDYQPVRKTREEIQEQIDYAQSTYNRLGEGNSGLSIRPDPIKPSILGVSIDAQNRLWVRLGSVPGIVFRVYDMTGEVLFHAGVVGPGDDPGYLDWAVNIDENGFLAIPQYSEDYYRVYMLELVPRD